jgi:hypothetical protein
LGDVNDAVTTLGLIRKPHSGARRRAELTLARAQARGGDVEGALKTSGSVVSEHWRITLWVEAASACLETGDKEQASSMLGRAAREANAAGDPFVRAVTLADVAVHLAVAGKPREAAELLGRAIRDGESFPHWEKASVMRRIAVAQAMSGERAFAAMSFRAARSAAVGITGSEPRAAALTAIAKAQARVGDLPGALDTVRAAARGETEGERMCVRSALRDIAVAQAVAGNPVGALAAADAIDSSCSDRDIAVAAAATAWAEARDIPRALATANCIADPSRRAAAMLRIASGLARGGAPDAALRLAETVVYLEEAVRWLPPGERDRFDFRTPETWGKCFAFDGTLSFGLYREMVEKAIDVATAAMKLHVTLWPGRRGRFQDEFSSFEGEVIAALARAQAEAGEWRQALVWACRLRDPHQRILAVVGVADGIAPSKRVLLFDESPWEAY